MMASPPDKTGIGTGNPTHNPSFCLPTHVTEATIKEAKGGNQLGQIAALFSPQVSTEKCQGVEEKRERIMCAYKKARNMSRDLDSFGELMEDLKRTDGQMRAELSELFEQSGRLLKEIVKKEHVIHKQLEQEPSTRDYGNKIKEFQHHLRQHHCRVVVAGQISAGKSTLLNLFLGEEVLPNRLLSCTATICELMYGEENAAEFVSNDGKGHSIPFADKDNYIDKKDERERRFEHELVRLYMPVPFLKSGIALVDTPGVGENKEMWEVLTDYVTKNDVFGFIFVLKCDDSGGILRRFKEMLRELSMIKDKQGQLKLDPKSVIFVANFWDKVKEKDQEEVKKRIKETLKSESCLRGIELDSQLFFVNSRFAWHTWRVGLISNHYEELIKGVERFFPIGHKRKLNLSYMWLENLLLRVLHPVQAFLNKAESTLGTFFRDTGKILQKLTSIEESTQQAKLTVAEFLENQRSSLMNKMRAFLNSPSTMKAVTTWKFGEVPKEEYGDSWVLIEERIDEQIDARVSLVLQEWEVSTNSFEKAEEDVRQKIQAEYAQVLEMLEEVEKNLRDMSGSKAPQEQDVTSAMWESGWLDSGEEKSRQFKVDVAHNFSGEQPALHSILKNLTSIPASLFKMKKRARQQQKQRNAEEFQANKVQYMQERATTVFSRLRESEQIIRQLVDDQLNESEKMMEYVFSNIRALVQSNRALVAEVQQDKRGKPQLQDTYRPHAERLNDILEETISFMYKNIHDYTFPQHTLKAPDGPFRPGKGSKQSLVSTVTELSGPGNQIVSVKQMQKGSAFKLRHLFQMAENIRKLSMYAGAKKYMAAYLGTGMYNNQPGLVFSGRMLHAREALMRARQVKTGMNRKAYIQNDFKPFMMSVSEAVEFLHLRRLVHVELSVDTVYWEHNNAKLTNIFESTEVAYPSDVDYHQQPAGNYVYMAPETFPTNGGKRYSYAADVYALGLMFLELWSQHDLYQPQKEKDLGAFTSSDPGKALFQCSATLQPIFRQHLPETLIQKCLSLDPAKRPSASQFKRELMYFNRENYNVTGTPGVLSIPSAPVQESSV